MTHSVQSRLKRALDITGSLVALAVAGPVILLAAALIRLTMKSPVLFRQQRPGLHGRLFTLLKFRTMSDERDPGGWLLPDAQRMTRLGRWLRRLSIDELPQFWNVLQGDMSLVGPRPLLIEYLSHYDQFQKRRHEVKPGITGWAQIHGRNGIDWEEKFRLDVWYVDNRSVSLDLRILLRTLWLTLRGSGISQPGHATMPRFAGGPLCQDDSQEIY